MLLNKEIQMQRPNKLHNKTQQPVEEKIQLHKDPTHCIIRSNQLLTFLNTTDYVHTVKAINHIQALIQTTNLYNTLLSTEV